MRNVGLLFGREMRSYFVSPVAYALLVAFLALSGWFFYNQVTQFLELASKLTDQAMTFQQAPPVFNVNGFVTRRWFNFASQLLIFLAPLITMRLLAEERGSGRLDLLLSAPVTDAQLVIGKYLSGVALCALFLVPTAIYPLMLFGYGNPEVGPIVSGYLGLLLLSAALIGLGLAVSSLTGSPVVAAASSYGIILFFWVLGIIAQGATTGWRAGLAYASLMDHFTDFANGVIESRHVVYYLTFALLAGFVALRAVESQRWRG